MTFTNAIIKVLTRTMLALSLSTVIVDASGKFVTGDPDLKR